MKIGLMSDTHDNLVAVDKALAKLESRGVKTVFHAGDMVAPFSLLSFKNSFLEKFYFVFGNNDGEKVGLTAVADSSDGRLVCLENEGVVELAGKKIFMTHDSALSILVAQSGQFDFCFGGHDHRQRKETYGQSIFVNPGNLTIKREGDFYKSADHCIAIVDLETGEVERIDI